jgi:hypothetical protein
MRNDGVNRRAVLLDAIGLASLAVEVLVILHWVLPADGYLLIEFSVLFLILASGGIYVWHSEKFSKDISEPSEWLAATAMSFVFGAASFVVDVLAGGHPGLSLLEAAMRAGSPFGFMLTLIIWGFTVIAFAGFVRSVGNLLLPK